MQVDHQPTKILITGKSGSGKSTYQLRYVRHSDYDRYFIFDHKMEFQKRLGVIPCLTIEECVEKVKKGERYISWHHSHEYPGDMQSGFEFYCEWVYEVAKALREDGSKSIFVCDEVNRFTGTSAGSMGWSFTQLIEDGRLQGLDFIGTSHAANQINNRLRMQLSEVVALRCKDRIPLEFLEQCGFDPEEVKRLPIGAFIALDCDSDTFTRGRLFSCPRGSNVIEADETPTDHALPHSPEDGLSSGDGSDAVQHV